MIGTFDKKYLEYLDEKLYKYRIIDYKINQLKYQIEHYTKHADINHNIKSNIINKPVENIVIRWDENIDLKNLYNFKNTINELLKQLNEENRLIFATRWLDESKPTWEEVAHTLGMSIRKVRDKRNIILNLYGELRAGL